MALITKSDIDKADQAVTDARATLRRIGHTNGLAGHAQEGLTRRIGEAETLKEEHAKQQTILKERAKAEKAAKTDLDAMATALEATADRAAQATADASEALSRLIAAMGDHDAALAEACTRLASLGLTTHGGEGQFDFEHDTGYTTAGHVKLAGKWWIGWSAYALTLRALGEIAGERFGPRHEFTLHCRTHRLVTAMRSRSDALTERLTG